MQRLLAVIFCVFMLWFCGIKPFAGEIWFFKGLKSSDAGLRERYLKKAALLDKNNSQFQLELASFYATVAIFPEKSLFWLENVIINHNGDLVPWALWYFKGLSYLKLQNPYIALKCLEASLSYNPRFEPAKELKEQIIQYSKQ
jgi:tetratricopeptide (TPR) repeat protein